MRNNNTEITFPHYHNFSLSSSGWGNAQHADIIAICESVIEHFYSFSDADLIKPYKVIVEPVNNHPQFNKYKYFNKIGLSSRDKDWAKYSYQFSHELCHFISDTSWFELGSKFGWFEEAICEMASIFIMRKLSISWLTKPPYHNWKDYAPNFATNAQSNIDIHKVDLSVSMEDWLVENITKVEANRYLRRENMYVALKMLPIFDSIPELWKAVQYLKNISVNNRMSFQEFMIAWKSCLPVHLIDSFEKLSAAFY